jgi:hypothetical protein
MKQQDEFNPEHRHEHAAEQQMAQNTVKEFAGAEDLLRFDSEQTAVPAAIAERLQKSSADFPKPNRSWWKRLFGQ